MGTRCYLAGLKDPEHAASGTMGGSIMETAVLSEIIKASTQCGIDPQIYSWRTVAGTEVDIGISIRPNFSQIRRFVQQVPRPQVVPF